MIILHNSNRASDAVTAILFCSTRKNVMNLFFVMNLFTFSTFHHDIQHPKNNHT